MYQYRDNKLSRVDTGNTEERLSHSDPVNEEELPDKTNKQEIVIADSMATGESDEAFVANAADEGVDAELPDMDSFKEEPPGGMDVPEIVIPDSFDTEDEGLISDMDVINEGGDPELPNMDTVDQELAGESAAQTNNGESINTRTANSAGNDIDDTNVDGDGEYEDEDEDDDEDTDGEYVPDRNCHVSRIPARERSTRNARRSAQLAEYVQWAEVAPSNLEEDGITDME